MNCGTCRAWAAPGWRPAQRSPSGGPGSRSGTPSSCPKAGCLGGPAQRRTPASHACAQQNSGVRIMVTLNWKLLMENLNVGEPALCGAFTQSDCRRNMQCKCYDARDALATISAERQKEFPGCPISPAATSRADAGDRGSLSCTGTGMRGPAGRPLSQGRARPPA